jgi:hypothetical protein
VEKVSPMAFASVVNALPETVGVVVPNRGRAAGTAGEVDGLPPLGQRPGRRRCSAAGGPSRAGDPHLRPGQEAEPGQGRARAGYQVEKRRTVIELVGGGPRVLRVTETRIPLRRLHRAAGQRRPPSSYGSATPGAPSRRCGCRRSRRCSTTGWRRFPAARHTTRRAPSVRVA